MVAITCGLVGGVAPVQFGLVAPDAGEAFTAFSVC